MRTIEKFVIWLLQRLIFVIKRHHCDCWIPWTSSLFSRSNILFCIYYKKIRREWMYPPWSCSDFFTWRSLCAFIILHGVLLLFWHSKSVSLIEIFKIKMHNFSIFNVEEYVKMYKRTTRWTTKESEKDLRLLHNLSIRWCNRRRRSLWPWLNSVRKSNFEPAIFRKFIRDYLANDDRYGKSYCA